MYRTSVQKVIFPMLELGHGSGIQRRLAFLQDSERWDLSRLRNFQEEKLRRLLNHAYEHVPYYRRVFRERNLLPKNIDPSNLDRLPILDKDTIRNHQRDLLATNIPKARLIHSATSGSTGQPLEFYRTRQQEDWYWALRYRAWAWGGYELGDPYIRASWKKRPMKKKVQHWLTRCTYFQFAHVNDALLDRYIRRMRGSRIRFAEGFPSTFFLLANYARKQGVDDIRLESIMTSGEMLFPHYRSLIESQFHTRIFDNYAAGGEGLTMAAQCEFRQGYHMNMESVVLEFLLNERPVAAGEVGKIYITALDNFAFPLIRYDIEDVGRPTTQKCPCGRHLTLMESVEGRTADIIVTPEGYFIGVSFFMALFKQVSGIQTFQIVQEKDYRLHIRIVKNNAFPSNGVDSLRRKISEMCNNTLEMQFEFVDDIAPASSNKRRFVISHAPLNSPVSVADQSPQLEKIAV
ncbi:MAG: phenylacetate--CoA ligase family protein [Candidatus Zhuqueibacterota bacterium]